jgi:hypothetical protein
VLAIAQMGVHLVFFLHITTGADNTNNVLALAFGVLIVTLVVRQLALDHVQLERKHDATGRADEYANAVLNAFKDRSQNGANACDGTSCSLPAIATGSLKSRSGSMMR